MKRESILPPDFIYDSTFASKLKRCRESKQLTQREVAHRAGISHGYYAQMELGKALLKDQTKLKALADTLGVPYERLLQDVEILSKDITDLLKYYPNLLYLLQTAINSMSSIERIRSVDLVERRIPYFNEDHSKLADNIRLFLLRKLGLNDIPENGLRPLAHYVMPLSRKVEEWHPE